MNAPKDEKTLSTGDKQAISWNLVLISLIVTALPYVILVCTAIISPTYFMPFLNNAMGRIILIVLAVWNALGMCFLVGEAKKGFSRAFLAKWGLAIMVFVLPLLLVTMLGPAILTINQALTNIYK